MSPELRYSARWVPPWFAAGFFVVFIPFAWATWVILLTPPPHPDAIRILVPVALPMLYLLLQLIFNHRHVHVTPTEVCITHGPIPGGNSLTLQRADIRLCYARKVLGLQVAGVESHRALLVDVASPMLTLMDSRAAAYRIRTVLNAHPSAPALDVGPSTPPLRYTPPSISPTTSPPTSSPASPSPSPPPTSSYSPVMRAASASPTASDAVLAAVRHSATSEPGSSW